MNNTDPRLHRSGVHVPPSVKYTLEEAERILARRDCQHHGHHWEVIEVDGVGPVALLCARCGTTRKVSEDVHLT